MAGDWIKFETATLDKFEVQVIAADLGIDPDAVIGKLLRVWTWFDTHTQDGHANVTLERDKCHADVTQERDRGLNIATLKGHLDRLTRIDGFCSAMAKVGWLDVSEDAISLPRFSRHNGKTTKNRALAADRKKRERERKVCHANVTLERDKSVTREEKRIYKKNIQKKTPPAPKKTALPDDFAVSDNVRKWANKHGYRDLDKHLAHFRDTATARGYQYIDWDSAFRNAIRSDWAGLRDRRGSAPPEDSLYSTRLDEI